MNEAPRYSPISSDTQGKARKKRFPISPPVGLLSVFSSGAELIWFRTGSPRVSWKMSLGAEAINSVEKTSARRLGLESVYEYI